MLSAALAGPLLSCSLQRTRPLFLAALAQRTASSSASTISRRALETTTARTTLPLLLNSAAFVSSPMLHHRSLLVSPPACFSLSQFGSQRQHISMSSTQEASPRKESGRKPASKERTQRAVTANANANADGASPSPQPPQRRRRAGGAGPLGVLRPEASRTRRRARGRPGRCRR